MELIILPTVPEKILVESRSDFVDYYCKLYKSYPPKDFGLNSIEDLGQWIQSEFDRFSKYQMIIAKINDQIVGYCFFTIDQSYSYVLQFWPSQNGQSHQEEMAIQLMKMLSKPLRGVIRKSNKSGIDFYQKFGGCILDDFDNFPKEIYDHYSKDIYIGMQVNA